MDPQTPPEIWEYVPAGEYKLPAASIGSTFKGGLAGLWQRLKPAKPQEPKDPLWSEKDLRRLPGPLLTGAAPRPTWGEAAARLEAAVAARSKRQGKALSPTVVIGLPHGGNAEILEAAAESRGWRLIAAPTPEQVLSEDPAWLAQMENEGGPWVVPALERCYLRHPHGLALVRRFFDRLDTGRLGEGLVGCDSWAWAYLRRAVRGCPPRALVAQALDRERLSAWLRQLAEGDELQEVLFRQSDSGALVLPPPAALADAVDTTAGESDFLTHLAAHSRGIPGIAWSLWRDALRSCPDEDLAAEKDAEGTCEMGQAVWVLPWGEIEKPALAAGFGVEHALVLHALLLHDGLAADLLAEVLPLATGAALGVFSELREAGLLEDRQDTLRVSAAGYPAVRQHLNGEGYLTDEF